jgi:hypothetical protein
VSLTDLHELANEIGEAKNAPGALSAFLGFRMSSRDGVREEATFEFGIDPVPNGPCELIEPPLLC